MQTYENQQEIGIVDLIDTLRHNLIFIILSIMISLFIALLISGVSFLMNRSVETYNLTTNISLTGDDITEQVVTIIINSFSHSSVVSPAETKLNITSPEYKVFSKRSDSVGILQLIVEGPDAKLLTNLSNEVFNTVKPLIEAAFPTLELRKLEISTPKTTLQSTQPYVNWVLNVFSGIMLGGTASILYVFIVYFNSPNIVQDNELESLFNTKILGKFVDKPRKQTIRKLLEVR